MTLAAGTRLGAYEILEPLGSGGMGEVYRARDSRLGREVAIKVLPASLSADSDRLHRFEREAKAASLLNHPNITVVYDVGTTNGTSWIAMELVDGKTLRRLIDHRPLSTRTVLSLAAQLANGLARAHAAGVVHRDLKPDNVMVTEDGRIKILDFGLAKVAFPNAEPQVSATDRTDTEPGSVLGTVSYMSPEQLKGQPADARSDIFAFGAILYELIAGKRAFRGDTPAETVSAILRDDAPELPLTDERFSPGLDRLIRHCLEKKPERRFQSAQDLEFALDALSGVSRPGSLSHASLSRRFPSARWLLAAGLIAIAAVVGLLWRRELPRAPISFKMLTFRSGLVWSARFTPDGQTVVYSAGWDGDPLRIYQTRLGSPESHPLDLPGADLLSISRTGTLAIRLGELDTETGTIAEAPLNGGAPKEILAGARWATWSPDGRLAVARPVNERYRLEFPVGHVLYETSGFIRSPTFSPQGDKIAFEDHPFPLSPAGAVAVVSLSGKLSRISRIWPNSLGGLAWSPSGREVLYSAVDGSAGPGIFASTLTGRERLLAHVPGGAGLQDVSVDGRALVVRFTDRNFMFFHGPGDVNPRNLYWLDKSSPEALSEDGHTLLFAEFGAATEIVHGVPLAYLRRTDGSPPKRLGIGYPSDLSPDGRWAIVTPQEKPAQFVLLPTGPGEPKPLPRDSIDHIRARFFPDGKRIVFSGSEPGRSPQLFVQDLGQGTPHAISPGGIDVEEFIVSPDAQVVVGIGPNGKLILYPVSGGPPVPVPGANAGDAPIQWSSDGAGIYVVQWSRPGGQILRIERATGRRQLLHELSPADPTGVFERMGARITPDGQSYVWSYNREAGELYLVDGLTLTASDGKANQLFRMPAAGGPMQQLTSGFE